MPNSNNGKLLVRSGNEVDKGTLENGEPYISRDSNKVHFGNQAGQELNFKSINVPSDDEKNALTGSNGTPATGNEYVTDSDPRNADTRTPKDDSATFLKLTSQQRAWKAHNGFLQEDDLVLAHQSLPNNFAVTDKNGNMHWMVEEPRANWDPTNEFASGEKHPAFTVNGSQKRILIGKFQASEYGGQLVTWANQIPKVNQDFDTQLASALALNDPGNNIEGFHLMTNAEWALVAQRCFKRSTVPYGNNDYGKDIDRKDITFRMSDPTVFDSQSGDGKSYTGSGGFLTSHDHTPAGIFDLNGNVWERVGGMRIDDGEIQIIADNDAADPNADHSNSSSDWKAILEDGSLVAPGTADTLKINSSGDISKTTNSNSSNKTFESVGVAADVSAASAGIKLLKKLLLFPYTTGLSGDYFYYNTDLERFPLRGGFWLYGTKAGLFYLGLRFERSYSFNYVGFRLAFML